MSKSTTLALCVICSLPCLAELVYLDATDGAHGNTQISDGSVLSATDSSGDKTWRQRDNAISGSHLTVFEGVDPSPELMTIITGLTPGLRYEVLVHFWDPQSTEEDWNVRAGFASGELTTFSREAGAVSGGMASGRASQLDYAVRPTRVGPDSGREMLAASLGLVTADKKGEIRVFIDDLGSTDVNQRTWYDGLSFRPAGALVPGADEDRDGLTNGEEAALGTDPYQADSDGDGASDMDEILAGSDPLDPGSVPPPPGGAVVIASDGAWTWFNDERVIFHRGSLFCGYVKRDGQYAVTRFDPAKNSASEAIISTDMSRQRDDHNNPSITPLPDGRLLALYAKHGDVAEFYQRTSVTPLPSSEADWGPEIAHPLPANNTYNNTFRLAGESNRIYNFHRCINFNPTMTISDNAGETWYRSIHLIASGNGIVRPYARYCSNHDKRIDLIYTGGHPRDIADSIYHLYYEGGSFRRTDGSVVKAFRDLPLNHDEGETGSVVYRYSSLPLAHGQTIDDHIPAGRPWVWDIQYGSDGSPVCVFQVQRDDVTGSGWENDRIYYYYARWDGGSWQRKFIAHAGRPLYASEDDYAAGITIDPVNSNVVYLSTNAADPFALEDLDNVPLVAGERYELYRGETTDGGKTFEWEPVTSGSVKDNLRPVVPEDHGCRRAVIWLHGDYSSYTDFDCEIVALLENQDQTKESARHDRGVSSDEDPALSIGDEKGN